jgi:hypothetical protein
MRSFLGLLKQGTGGISYEYNKYPSIIKRKQKREGPMNTSTMIKKFYQQRRKRQEKSNVILAELQPSSSFWRLIFKIIL